MKFGRIGQAQRDKSLERISLDGISNFTEEDIHLNRELRQCTTSYQRMYLLDWN